jgi:hypothetical protein
MPDIMPPTMKSAIKGSGGRNTTYSYLGAEEEDDEQLAMPPDVTPYNTPWNTNYKKMNHFE